MTDNNLLWSGESVFCECGHHIEYHKTGMGYAVFWKNNFYASCNLKDCKCQEFRPKRDIK